MQQIGLLRPGGDGGGSGLAEAAAAAVEEPICYIFVSVIAVFLLYDTPNKRCCLLLYDSVYE